MTTFDDREKAFENMFVHDAELMFRAEARRNKLLGLWAAGLMGREGDDAAGYASDIVKLDFKDSGHEDVLRRVIGDLDGKVTEPMVRAKFAELLALAKRQVTEEA